MMAQLADLAVMISQSFERALFEAAKDGDIDEVNETLAAGADVNGVIEGDGSPLIQAAARGHLDIVTLLLDRGADVNQIVPGDENALMNASEQATCRWCSCWSAAAPMFTSGSGPSGQAPIGAASGVPPSARRARTGTPRWCRS